MRVTINTMKGHAQLTDLVKVAGAGIVGTVSPYFAAFLEGDIVNWVSVGLKVGVPTLTFIYMASKIYWLWKNKGR